MCKFERIGGRTGGISCSLRMSGPVPVWIVARLDCRPFGLVTPWSVVHGTVAAVARIAAICVSDGRAKNIRVADNWAADIIVHAAAGLPVRLLIFF